VLTLVLCGGTRQKVAGLILDDGFVIFHLASPSGRTMALGSTQPLNINE
jgi:hypothetical protein